MISAAAQADPDDVQLGIDLAKVENELLLLEYEMNQEIEVQFTKEEKAANKIAEKRHEERIKNLEVNREKVFGLILG